ncbi:putative protein CASP [Cocos nucifera]|uniref:Protein CASP n=1 Tax=Cocos nucifera TaxID=13894 RepID=A0A8K0HYG8_COCNU|nr:putative protein CASP [Cocos nucifera]
MEANQAGSERDKGNLPSPIAVVRSFWRDFDLEKERSGLDEQGLKIAENQEISQKNRRKLAESTRDFKKASADEKLNLFNSLLKNYQEEVDNLTKRAKFGEHVFLNIYQKLYEAPDPYPVLASIAEQDQKLSELESENRKMKLELEEYRTEATHLKNQQATIRRLEEQNRQLEQQMEEKVREIVEMKQRSLAEENQKTLEVLKERELLLQDQLRQAKESVSNMHKLHESAQSQLLELRTQSGIMLTLNKMQMRSSFLSYHEEERAAKEAEVNLLMDEVERAQARLLSLEREKGILHSQLRSTNQENENTSDYLESSNILESSLNAKEKIISELNMELRDMETALSNEREQHMNEIKKLNALLNEKETALTEMRKELQERPTAKLVDDLRKKVKILQAVGYNSVEAEDWELASSGEEMSKLESLLLDKNRKMEHELTQFKVKISEKTNLLEAAEAKIAELTAKVDEQQKLITKLEDDMLKGYSSTERKGSLLNDWDFQEMGTSEVSEGTDQRHDSDQDQSSMLKVICNQRDRFRMRLRETEEEMRQLKEKMGMLAVELENTKADNVKLYGKIRYVQDYSLERLVSRGPKKYAEDIESGFSSDVESKYKKMYEDDINPFAAFSKKLELHLTDSKFLMCKNDGSWSRVSNVLPFIDIIVFVSALFLFHVSSDTPTTYNCFRKGTKDGSCEILLNKLLLKSRPTADLKNVLLHEMIHAFLWIKNKKNEHSVHGPNFREMMDSINASSLTDHQRPSGGYNITIYHELEEEADTCRAGNWICEACGNLIKLGTKKDPSASDCIENVGPEGCCDNPSRQWHSNNRFFSGRCIKIQEPTECGSHEMSLKDEEELHEGRYKGFHYMTRQRKRKLCEPGTRDNLNGKKKVALKGGGPEDDLESKKVISEAGAKDSLCEAGPRDGQDGKKVTFGDGGTEDYLDGKRKGTFKGGGTKDGLDGKKEAISDYFASVGALAGNFDQLKGIESETRSRAAAPETSKRARTPTLKKQQACIGQKRRKLGRRKNDYTIKNDYTVASEWLDYFTCEESDENVEPLKNKRTERRKKQKLLRSLNGGGPSPVVGNEQQSVSIQTHEVGKNTSTAMTVVEIPDD